MKNFILLLSVSAIWGFSYIFMKILSPVYGGYFVAYSRLIIGGTFLLIYSLIKKTKFNIKDNYKHYLIIGLLNGAIPTVGFSVAALYIDASLSVIINCMAPILVSLYGIHFLKEKLSFKQIVGLTIAFTSIIYITYLKDSTQETQLLGIILALLATNSYALTSIYISLKASDVDPQAMSTMSTLAGSFIVMPLAIATVKTTEIGYIFEFMFLGVACTGIALAIYFYLLKEMGTKALSSTFLQPIFGSLWAVIFLGEKLTMPMIITTFTIIFGVYIFLSDEISTKKNSV